MENANPVTPAGDAPAAPVTPAPAAPAAPATPVVNPTPAAAPVVNQAPIMPKKKSKVGLIVTLIIIFVLLIGAGVGFFIWWQIHESPENAVADAFSKMLTADEMKASGKLTGKSSSGTDVTFEFDFASKDNAFSGNGKMSIEAEGQKLNFAIDGAMDSDGNVYFRLADKGNINDFLEQYLSEYSYYMDDDTVALISSALGTAVNKLGDSWYKIPADMKMGDSKNPLSCIAEKSKSANKKDAADKIKAAYKEHPFLKLDDKVESKDGYKLYTAEVDNDKYKEFSDELEDLDYYKDLTDCMSSSSSSSSKSESEKTKFDGKVELGISSWSHDLKYVGMTTEKNGEKVELEAKFDYSVDKVEIPSDAKTIEELVKEIKSEFAETYSKTIIAQYCTEEMNYMGMGKTECENYVKEYVKEMFGSDDDDSGINIEDIIENFSLETNTSGATSLMGNIGGAKK